MCFSNSVLYFFAYFLSCLYIFLKQFFYIYKIQMYDMLAKDIVKNFVEKYNALVKNLKGMEEENNKMIEKYNYYVNVENLLNIYLNENKHHTGGKIVKTF